ncbi:receptor-type tyrosine-protein phosphatase epsilon-like [Ruditapes philippinarum]|uniref:receptor-type tyrosine-protein phosphatase epsilon-like n=1 Tax=Ruditapes philippinarum TaxID=129788 RepID=UPI00295AD9AD|nr:receptor-type tyrosine-protein phosphatase epsilon-like [Ruditapes philippinarum]
MQTGFLGNKCEKCQVGLYGQNCDINCPIGCANNNCTTEGVCYSCKSGKYGIDCTGSCSVGCDFNSCFDNGDCPKCRKLFTGRKCDQCIDGKFGDNCGLNCSTTCLACYSLTNCSACVEKHWGNTCQQCPTNCLNCSSNSICSLCVKGFHGQICNEQCNVNCLDGHCNQLYGNCSEGCVDGFYGEACDLKCSPYCANSICGRENGNCLHGCKAGHNGTKCSQTLELKEEGNGDMNVVIGATAGGVLILIVILVIVITIILIKRRRRGDKQDNNNKGTKTEDANMTYSEINDIHMTAENNHTDDIETERENINYSEIQDAVLSTKSQESDNVYAKPIKPKRKTEGVKSLNKTSTEVTVNNPTYEKPDTSQTETVKTNKIKKPPIASKPAKKYDNNVIPRPTGMQPTSNVSHIQNDAALEIEEDIDRLSSRSKSVFLEEQKAAELDNVDTYYNVAAVIKRKITIDKLPEFVAKKTKKDFVDEFQSLPAMLIKPYVDSQKRENRSKNRYKGIYPYDDSRVVLKEGDSDYINASYIDGYNKNKAYIASIGPTFKYMGDMSAFWIMVWQEHVGKIVMLTNLEEGGVPKCDQYWPEKDFSLMFANIQVTCHTEENYADYTFRSFSVQKDSIKREIVQVHFTAWPDKGTPDDVTSLIEFRQKVNSTKTKLDGPIFVHCSAGIGRTGTYIALDSITNEGETEGAVDIYAFVRNMREQRVNMIQTAEQYQYLHNALVHTLTFDSKAVEASVFSDYMKTHTEAHLGNMFEKLQASVEQRSDDEQEAVKRNKALVNKNRNGADIPGDRNRPRLFMAKTLGQSDYSNAVYVNSFKNVNRFLIAQTPLPDTVEDFLTLIVQEKVSCVIGMETTLSGNKDVGIYCPVDNQTLRKGAFTIKTERGDGTDQYQLKKMKISYKSKSGSEELIVPHVQYIQWDNNKSIPEEPVKFVQFVKDMELKFSGTDTNRPMLIHCLTGAKKGGLFCVVSTLLEKTQIDQEVSVANTVRQVKYRRHVAIPDKEQYIFCHHCVNEYLRTFDIYSNFELKT